MKKIICILLCILLSIPLFGCNLQNTTYTILPRERTNRTVDVDIIDKFLTGNDDDYFDYESIKEKRPDVLSYLEDITPEPLQNKCSIYRFREYYFDTQTFLVYDNAVYPLGQGGGGYGVTEFAYTDTNQDILYFIYSWGSGMHRSHIGMFNFETKQMSDYIEDAFYGPDIAFYLSEDGQRLGVCYASIIPTDYYGDFISITKGEIIYEDITVLDFIVLDEGK